MSPVAIPISPPTLRRAVLRARLQFLHDKFVDFSLACWAAMKRAFMMARSPELP